MNRVVILTSITALMMLAEPVIVEMFPMLALALPELGLVALLYFAYGIKESTYQGAAGAVVLGYLMDLLSGAPVGVFSFVYVVTYFLARMISGKIFARTWVVQMILGGMTSIVAGIMILSLDKWLNAMPHTWASLSRIPLQALSTAIVTPFYFQALWRVDKRLSYEAQGEGVFR